MNSQVKSKFIQRFSEALIQPLNLKSRILVVLAAVVLVPTFILPLWHMEFWAQQYPEGLELHIYSHSLVGGDDGNDLAEINILNHYIGMAELDPEDFVELKWIPLVVSVLGAFVLRAAVLGTVGSIVDIMVMCFYFALFSLWSFYSKLSAYGHQLDPKAAVQVQPFSPPVFGHKMVGQFDVWSYPAAGVYMFVIFGVLLLAAMWLSWPRRDSKTTK